jgi:hypothetical protein
LLDGQQRQPVTFLGTRSTGETDIGTRGFVVLAGNNQPLCTRLSRHPAGAARRRTSTDNQSRGDQHEACHSVALTGTMSRSFVHGTSDSRLQKR